MDDMYTITYQLSGALRAALARMTSDQLSELMSYPLQPVDQDMVIPDSIRMSRWSSMI
jgi:hypothetical protein